jgi:hypothetical protein
MQSRKNVLQNKKELILAMAADKKQDFQTAKMLMMQNTQRRKLGIELEYKILQGNVGITQAEAAMLRASKDLPAARAQEQERLRYISNLQQSYLAEFKASGGNKKAIDRLNSRYKDIFPKQKDLFALDTNRPLDAGVNKYMKKTGAPWYTAKITKRPMFPIGTPVAQAKNIDAVKKGIRKQTSTPMNTYTEWQLVPADIRKKWGKLKNNKLTQKQLILLREYMLGQTEVGGLLKGKTTNKRIYNTKTKQLE